MALDPMNSTNMNVPKNNNQLKVQDLPKNW